MIWACSHWSAKGLGWDLIETFNVVKFCSEILFHKNIDFRARRSRNKLTEPLSRLIVRMHFSSNRVTNGQSKLSRITTEAHSATDHKVELDRTLNEAS